MNEKAMEALFDKLSEYRRGENPGIRRWSDWKDEYCGTRVSFDIGEYNIECHFWPTEGDEWELCIFPELHRDARYWLTDESIKFTEDCPEIYQLIDKMIEVLRGMPKVVDVLKDQYRKGMSK